MTIPRTLQRVILPLTPAPDVMPLYVTSPDDEATRERDGVWEPDAVLGRRRLRVAPGRTASFGTYFNAFPASYWRRWTGLDEVELQVSAAGPGTVRVYCSTSDGQARLSDRRELGDTPLRFPVPLSQFDDGGWCWFEMTAGAQPVVLESAEWIGGDGAAPAPAPASVAVAITTLNRPGYVIDLLRALGSESLVRAAISTVVVVDQGDQRVRQHEGFAAAAEGLGDRLRLVEQDNLGGSGGFARGMREAMSVAGTRHVLLLDDDVALEPESLLRAQVFATLCRHPTIVGGHMLNLLDRSRLHTFGEVVGLRPYDWGPAAGVQEDHDFAAQSLAATAWMHRRIDVDYTGWWMCLIPTEVLRDVGLAAPYFIAWDDAEFALRAGGRGYPTVTLPGMAVWHLPFTGKSELSDWKVYFNHRNRLITALLHHPQVTATRAFRDSFVEQLRNAATMNYAAAHLRLAAVEDVLAGPGELFPGLARKLGQARAIRDGYPDAAIRPAAEASDPRTQPPVSRQPRGAPSGGALAKGLSAGAGLARQLRRVPHPSRQGPAALVADARASWRLLMRSDSAQVWTSDRSGVRSYQRDRAVFLQLQRRHALAHLRLLVRWPALRRQYRDSWPELTSDTAWAAALGAGQRPGLSGRPSVK